MPTFHKHLKRRLLSAIGMREVPRVCCLNWNGNRDALTRNKARLPCSDLDGGSSFISQDEEMSESPEETLEKDIVPCLISTGGLTSFWQLKRQVFFSASKGDDAWLLLKIDMIPNIPVEIGKVPSVSRLTLRGIPMALLNLEENAEVSLTTGQESWCRLINVKGHPHLNSRTYCRFLPQLEKYPETCSSPWDEARFPCTACRAIPCSPSNTKGALTSWMDLQRVAKNTVTNL